MERQDVLRPTTSNFRWVPQIGFQFFQIGRNAVVHFVTYFVCVCVVKDASTKEMQLCHWPNDVHIVTLDLGVHNIETQEEEQGVVRSQGELWQKMKKDDAESQRRPLMASLVRKCLGSYFQK